MQTPEKGAPLLEIQGSRIQQLLLRAWATKSGRTNHRAVLEAIMDDRVIELRVVEVLLWSALDCFRNVSNSLDGLVVKESALDLVGKLLSMIHQFATEGVGMSEPMVEAIIRSHVSGVDALGRMNSVLAKEQG